MMMLFEHALLSSHALLSYSNLLTPKRVLIQQSVITSIHGLKNGTTNSILKNGTTILDYWHIQQTRIGVSAGTTTNLTLAIVVPFATTILGKP